MQDGNRSVSDILRTFTPHERKSLLFMIDKIIKSGDDYIDPIDKTKTKHKDILSKMTYQKKLAAGTMMHRAINSVLDSSLAETIEVNE